MRTKEIEVYVHKNIIDNGVYEKGSKMLPSLEFPDAQWIKAKLIIELPERKVTISESEFDKAWELSSKYKWTTMKEDVKANLFKE